MMLAATLHCKGHPVPARPVCIGASTERERCCGAHSSKTEGMAARLSSCSALCAAGADVSCVAAAQSGEKQGKVTKLSKSEVLMLNIGSMCTGAKVLAVRLQPSIRGLYDRLFPAFRMCLRSFAHSVLRCRCWFVCQAWRCVAREASPPCGAQPQLSRCCRLCSIHPAATDHGNVPFTQTRSFLHALQVKGDLAKLQLTSPVCTKEGEKIALSRRVEKHWRLIGWGQIQKGLSISMPGRQ